MGRQIMLGVVAKTIKVVFRRGQKAIVKETEKACRLNEVKRLH